MNEPEPPKCQGCSEEVELNDWHTCPYQTEINGCDIECNCCSSCEQICRDDI